MLAPIIENFLEMSTGSPEFFPDFFAGSPGNREHLEGEGPSGALGFPVLCAVCPAAGGLPPARSGKTLIFGKAFDMGRGNATIEKHERECATGSEVRSEELGVRSFPLKNPPGIQGTREPPILTPTSSLLTPN